MKKLLMIFLVLLLLAAGLFFWKGGHHAIFLAEAIEQWLDEDNADQGLTLQLQRPGFTAQGDTLMPQVEQLSLTADTFWTEYGDLPLFGLTSNAMTAYTDGRILYLDTGKAYSLPQLSGLRKAVREAAFGLLLHGRVTKTGDTYEISMTRPELELQLSVTADPELRRIDLYTVTKNQTVIQATLMPRATQPHPIPQPVLDAMVLARMEKPMPLMEPLEILLPALQTALPLQGSLTLVVECGILNLTETAVLRMDRDKAELERNGVTAALPLPGDSTLVSPAALALLLLRNGACTRDDNGAHFELTIPAETTKELCTALVPKLADLGITFTDSCANVTIQDGALTCVTMTASGEIPFLIAAIPVSFKAELLIS